MDSKFKNIVLKPQRLQTSSLPPPTTNQKPEKPKPPPKPKHLQDKSHLTVPSATILDPSKRVSDVQPFITQKILQHIRAKHQTFIVTLLTETPLDPKELHDKNVQGQKVCMKALKNVLGSPERYKEYAPILKNFLKDDFHTELSRLVKVSKKVLEQCRTQYVMRLEEMMSANEDGMDPQEINSKDGEIRKEIMTALVNQFEEKVRRNEPMSCHLSYLQHHMDKYRDCIFEANLENLRRSGRVGATKTVEKVTVDQISTRLTMETPIKSSQSEAVVKSSRNPMIRTPSTEPYYVNIEALRAQLPQNTIPIPSSSQEKPPVLRRRSYDDIPQDSPSLQRQQPGSTAARRFEELFNPELPSQTNQLNERPRKSTHERSGNSTWTKIKSDWTATFRRKKN